MYISPGHHLSAFIPVKALALLLISWNTPERIILPSGYLSFILNALDNGWLINFTWAFLGSNEDKYFNTFWELLESSPGIPALAILFKFSTLFKIFSVVNGEVISLT